MQGQIFDKYQSSIPIKIIVEISKYFHHSLLFFLLGVFLIFVFFRTVFPAVLVYRCLNFSTLPAVSTNFCLPVKNGWQAEQISTRIFFTVERVWITFPQAQVIVVSKYLGCIFSFISVFSSLRSVP